MNSFDFYMDTLHQQYTSRCPSDLVAFATSKATEKLVEKMNLPTRYTEGGVVEVDSFLREKVFHIRLADRQSAS